MLRSAKAIKPLLDRVLVQRLQPEVKTASGIYLPEKSQEKLNQARVISVGPGGMDKDGKVIRPSVKEGDMVLLPSFGGNNIKIGKEEYILFKNQDILAVINQD